MEMCIRDRIYPSLAAALADTRVSEITCPYCGEQVSLTFSPQEGNTLFGYGRCNEGDEFLARIQHYRQEGNARKVKRIVYEMSDDLWAKMCIRDRSVPVRAPLCHEARHAVHALCHPEHSD